jgi:hypothetical protein
VAGWTLAIVVVLYLVVVLPWNARAEKSRRAELHLLNTIQGMLHSHLDAGGPLPTNWASLSNAVNWELLARICEYNHLPPPTELYTVLPRPIDLNPYHRSVFLVRTEPRRWPAQERGRWVMGVCFRWPDQPVFNNDTNRVDRNWFPEKLLPAAVRAQLEASAKK